MRNLVLAVAAGLMFSNDGFTQDQTTVDRPEVSREACPLEVISIATPDNHQATAVVRQPPGDGPFPAVILLLSFPR